MSDNLRAALSAAQVCDRVAFNNAIQNELLDKVNQSLETLKMKHASTLFDEKPEYSEMSPSEDSGEE